MNREEGAAERLEALGAAGTAFTRSPGYDAGYDEVSRLLNALNVGLPGYEARLGAETYTLVRTNLRVLTECFYGNALPPEAAGLIYEHLLTLSRMLAFRLN